MQKDPYANAVGTVCIPNFLMLQATLAGSTPAFAGEFSVFHAAVVGRSGYGCVPYILPTQEMTFPAIAWQHRVHQEVANSSKGRVCFC